MWNRRACRSHLETKQLLSIGKGLSLSSLLLSTAIIPILDCFTSNLDRIPGKMNEVRQRAGSSQLSRGWLRPCLGQDVGIIAVTEIQAMDQRSAV